MVEGSLEIYIYIYSVQSNASSSQPDRVGAYFQSPSKELLLNNNINFYIFLKNIYYKLLRDWISFFFFLAITPTRYDFRSAINLEASGSTGGKLNWKYILLIPTSANTTDWVQEPATLEIAQKREVFYIVHYRTCIATAIFYRCIQYCEFIFDVFTITTGRIWLTQSLKARLVVQDKAGTRESATLGSSPWQVSSVPSSDHHSIVAKRHCSTSFRKSYSNVNCGLADKSTLLDE